MKNPNVWRLAVIGLLSAQFARAEIARPPLPSAEDFKTRMPEQQVRPAGLSQAAEVARPESVCPVIDLSEGAAIEGRLLTLKKIFDVKSNGKPAGSITSDGKGYDLRDGKGRMGAFLRSQSEEGTSLITLSDCWGATLGSVVETGSRSDGARSFAVHGPSGESLGSTGLIGYRQGSIIVRDAAGKPLAELKKTHWYLDHWSLQMFSSGFDARLAAAVLMYNSEADGREAARGRSDRPGPKDL